MHIMKKSWEALWEALITPAGDFTPLARKIGTAMIITAVLIIIFIWLTPMPN